MVTFPMDAPSPQSPEAPAGLIEAILAAYAQGYFPMADPPRPRRGGPPRPGPIGWYNPDPRAIIPLEPGADGGGFHVSRSLRRTIRSRRFTLTSDTDFEGVIRACAEPRPGREESWIDARIIAAYTALHRAGHAHSIEARLAVEGGAGPLVGGIYGVRLGAAFFAESKFSRPELGGTDASKVCLAALVAHLRSRGFELLDVQIANPHTEQFGVVEIRRREYLSRLRRALERDPGWGEFDGAAVHSV